MLFQHRSATIHIKRMIFLDFPKDCWRKKTPTNAIRGRRHTGCFTHSSRSVIQPFARIPHVLATPSYWFCRKLGAGDTVSGSGHAGDGRSFRHVRLRLLLHARTLSHQHEVSIRWTMLFCKDGHDDDHFYIALFSALEQTHCALLACDSK